MDQEIIKPETAPRGSAQATSAPSCLLAAVGATLLTATKLGSAVAATVWAFSKLLGLPDAAMWSFMALGAVPVLWATAWVGGRAWHVERRLAQGLDIDTPVFKLAHYWRNG